MRVGAVSTTDPKQLNEKGGYYALFHGTFDLRSKKWLMAEALPLTRNEYDRIGDLFGDLELGSQEGADRVAEKARRHHFH